MFRICMCLELLDISTSNRFLTSCMHVRLCGALLQNPENLLIFAAGNDGQNKNVSCTVGTPATAKNVLSVGATTTGETRLSTTEMEYPGLNATIDTVANFSAFGPTLDGRIKPEVVAPGDMVRERLARLDSRCLGVEQ